MSAPRKVRWGSIVVLFCGPVLALSCLAFAGRVAWTVRESYGRAEMQKRLDALAAVDAPIDSVSTENAYLKRTSPEQTDRWLAVMEEFDTEDFRQSHQGVYNFDPALAEVPFEASGPWSCEPATRRFIEMRQPMVNELRELCLNDQPVRFPIYFDSINTLLPYTQHMRTAGRLLWTDGLIAIRDNDSSRIRSDIEALQNSAGVCSGEPFAVSQLVCIALDFMALELLKTAVEHDRLSLEDLKQLLPSLIERSKLKDQWRVMIEGERSTALPCFAHPDRAAEFNKAIHARGWDCVNYLDWMERALAIDTSSLDSLLAGAEQLNADFDESHRSGGWLKTVDSLMTGLMAPAFQAMAEAIVRNRSENRLAAHAVAVAIFHKQHGRWPTNFSELALGSTDLLPPGGKPFGYRLEPDGRACLWGFSLRQLCATPTEPPPLHGTPQTIEENLRCIWHIPAD